MIKYLVWYIKFHWRKEACSFGWYVQLIKNAISKYLDMNRTKSRKYVYAVPTLNMIFSDLLFEITQCYIYLYLIFDQQALNL